MSVFAGNTLGSLTGIRVIESPYLPEQTVSVSAAGGWLLVGTGTLTPGQRIRAAARREAARVVRDTLARLGHDTPPRPLMPFPLPGMAEAPGGWDWPGLDAELCAAGWHQGITDEDLVIDRLRPPQTWRVCRCGNYGRRIR